jgi:hypothetical protein
MISEAAARQIAATTLASLPQTEPLQLDLESIERPTHWVFLFNSVEFYRTGDDADGVAGGRPLAVAKNGGAVTWLNPRDRIEAQLP